MRVAGGILVGLGLALILVSAGLTIFGMRGAYQRAQSAGPQPSPAELAGDLQTATHYGLRCGALGFLMIVAGLPLLIVGVIRAAGKRRDGDSGAVEKA